MNTTDQIERLLRENFEVEYLEIQDNSHLHAGHAEAQKSGGGHYGVIICSPAFDDLPLIQRHRLVNKALQELMPEHIHALAIKAFSPEELS